MSVNKEDRNDHRKRNNTQRGNDTRGRGNRVSRSDRSGRGSSARESRTQGGTASPRKTSSSSPPRRLTAKGREMLRLEEIRRRKQQRMQILILGGVGVLALLLVVVFVLFPVLFSGKDPKPGSPPVGSPGSVLSGQSDSSENVAEGSVQSTPGVPGKGDPAEVSGEDTFEGTDKRPSEFRNEPISGSLDNTPSESQKAPPGAGNTPSESPKDESSDNPGKVPSESSKESSSDPSKETPSETPKQTEPGAPETEEETEPVVYTEPVSCRMVFVGDNLLHWTIQQSGMSTAEDGTTRFNYDHLYRNISPYVSAADIAVINQEVVTGGVELGLSTYPSFNAPCQIGDAVANAGFDVATMATNHIMDKGEDGVTNMLNYWHSHVPQVLTTGAYTSQEDRDRIPIYESNGLKIAFLNYTYGSNGGRGYYRYTINCLADRDQLVSDITRAKQEADYVVVCPHWGIEKSFDISAEQVEYMQLFAELGVDLVVGTHPHVVQPVQCYTNSDGKPMYVFYSLGNVISLQNTTPQMLGGFADITIHRDERGNITVEQAKMDFTVTHFQYDPSILLYYDITTYLWEDYTPELASVHGMNVLDPDNWSYDALKQLVNTYSSIRQ